MTDINENTTIEEIVKEHPELIRPLMQHGIKCVMCGEPIWGTLKEIARNKGIKNLSEILVELISVIEKKRRKVNF